MRLESIYSAGKIYNQDDYHKLLMSKLYSNEAVTRNMDMELSKYK